MATKRKKKLKKRKTITLPTETSGIDSAKSHTIFIYGAEGIGKSTFASLAPKCLFIATEAGLKFLDVYEEPCPDWETFIEIVNTLEAEKSGGYKSFAIDTGDNCFAQCQAFVCAKLGIEHPADEDWGKGYQAVRDEFNHQITRLALLNSRLIITSHEKTVEIKGRIIKTSKIVPTLSNTGRRVILPMCDLIGHCGFKVDRDGEPTEERIIDFNPSELIEAKDRTGLLPKVIPLDYEIFDAYMVGKKKKRGKVGSKKNRVKKRRVTS